MGCIASGDQRVFTRSHVTTAQHKNGLYHCWSPGLQVQASGAGGEGEASEEELGGGGVISRVGRE